MADAIRYASGILTIISFHHDKGERRNPIPASRLPKTFFIFRLIDIIWSQDRESNPGPAVIL